MNSIDRGKRKREFLQSGTEDGIPARTKSRLKKLLERYRTVCCYYTSIIFNGTDQRRLRQTTYRFKVNRRIFLIDMSCTPIIPIVRAK